MIDTKMLVMVLPLLLLQFGFSAFCLIKIFKGTTKNLPKWLWAIASLNTLGCVAFLMYGVGGKDE